MKVIRHLLRKNEKKQYSNSIHNEDLIDIPVYGPHDNILPVPYEVSGFFVEFEACFETRCRDFLSKTNLDKYNKDYMDELVDHMQDEAIGLLDVQGIGHRNAINQLARTRLSDINDATIRLNQIQIEKDLLIININKLEAIYNKGTALESIDRSNGREAGK